MSFWNSRRVKAGKRHRCIWCFQAIEKGEIHAHESGIYDGDFQDQRWHLECLRAFDEESRELHEYDIFPGENERPFIHEGANI